MNGQAKTQEPSEYVRNVKVPTGTGKREFIIYKATNLINGKSYIGQTVQAIGDRKSSHIRTSKGRTSYCFHSAIRKYGSDAFVWETICLCSSKKESDAKECEFIKAFNTKVPLGYNLTDGGDGRLGFCPSKETRSKVSRALKGRKKTDEHRAKLSEALKGRKIAEETRLKMIGRKHSKETKAKVSKVLMGNKHMAGRKVPEETKLKISRALKGKKKPDGFSDKLKGNKNSLGYKHSEETRAKARGKKRSDETKAKISKSLKGRKKSDETRARMSKSMRGIKKTDEHKAKLSKILKGRKRIAGAPPLRRVK